MIEVRRRCDGCYTWVFRSWCGVNDTGEEALQAAWRIYGGHIPALVYT